MRSVRMLLVVTASLAALMVLAPAAGASTPQVAKGCKTFTTLNRELGKINPSASKSFNSKALRAAAAAFRKAAKHAPAKVKSAMNTIAAVYAAIGSKGNAAGALTAYSQNAQKFTKAISAWTTYYATNCIGAS